MLPPTAAPLCRSVALPRRHFSEALSSIGLMVAILLCSTPSLLCRGGCDEWIETSAWHPSRLTNIRAVTSPCGEPQPLAALQQVHLAPSVILACIPTSMVTQRSTATLAPRT